VPRTAFTFWRVFELELDDDSAAACLGIGTTLPAILTAIPPSYMRCQPRTFVPNHRISGVLLVNAVTTVSILAWTYSLSSNLQCLVVGLVKSLIEVVVGTCQWSYLRLRSIQSAAALCHRKAVFSPMLPGSCSLRCLPHSIHTSNAIAWTLHSRAL
jgi:hypothetical protein